MGHQIAKVDNPELSLLEQDCTFMDKNEPRKEVSEDVTRESLIALSYTAPEKETADRQSNETLTGKTVAEALKADADDKYRSKLISISYPLSPDTKTLPDLPGESRG